MQLIFRIVTGHKEIETYIKREKKEFEKYKKELKNEPENFESEDDVIEISEAEAESIDTERSNNYSQYRNSIDIKLINNLKKNYTNLTELI